jgi:hypothetical protein
LRCAFFPQRPLEEGWILVEVEHTARLNVQAGLEAIIVLL